MALCSNGCGYVVRSTRALDHVARRKELENRLSFFSRNTPGLESKVSLVLLPRSEVGAPRQAGDLQIVRKIHRPTIRGEATSLSGYGAQLREIAVTSLGDLRSEPIR